MAALTCFGLPISKAVILNNYISTNAGESILFILEPRFEHVNLSDVILRCPSAEASS